MALVTNTGTRARTLPAAAALLLGLAACGGTSTASLPPGTPAQFTVRGRLENPRRISFRIEPAPAPIDGAAFARAVERAAAIWNDTGVVAFVPAGDGELADVTLGFRTGVHDRCPPLGDGFDVAHTGPTAPGTFVHFDAARPWSENEGNGALSLFSTALHELGHVLGIDHSEADDAVMGTAVHRPLGLSIHDLAGLWSLYGGGDDGPGDLLVTRGGGEPVAFLRRAAPPATTEFAVFNTDGDEDAEVLVWRTDRAGHGALMIYHFAHGPVLARTLGPFWGAVGPGAKVEFAVGDDHERWLLVTFANGARTVRAFSLDGLLVTPGREPTAAEAARAGAPIEGDLDGQGEFETVSRR